MNVEGEFWCCRNAYNMVINKFGDKLYNGLVQTQTEHLKLVAAKIEAAQGETFLRELKLRWDHHNKSMQMIRDILMVLLHPSWPHASPPPLWLHACFDLLARVKPVPYNSHHPLSVHAMGPARGKCGVEHSATLRNLKSITLQRNLRDV